MGHSLEVLHLIHSLNPSTGGVLSAVQLLNEALLKSGVDSRISDKPNARVRNNREWIIAHGLWQWPGQRARELRNPYLVYPHGMLDPWFKKSYLIKHLKKQFYWWLRQGDILRNAQAVCFTTEEERRLAQGTFFPYRCKEVVTGLGVNDPPPGEDEQSTAYFGQFPNLRDRRILLYLGRFHPKKGLDDLIRAWKKLRIKDSDILVLAGPIEENNPWINHLKKLAGTDPSIYWTGMLEGQLKWGALRTADAMILPSHQENYGMVVAEACSVGLPAYLTNKVNLWSEVIKAGAGRVAPDNQEGIENLLNQWLIDSRPKLSTAAQKCFEERLHIKQTVKSLIGIISESTP